MTDYIHGIYENENFYHNPRYVCPKHGEQPGGVRLEKGGKEIRHYCSECVLEFWDKYCEQLQEIVEDTPT